MAESEITLIVFPFENFSIGGENNLLCESFSIELATELARFRQFSVIEHAAQPVAGPAGDEESDRNFGVDYLIKGTLRGSGDNIIINARLINAHTNRLIWADRFEGVIADIINLQEDLLLKIASSLQAQVDHDMLSKLRKKKDVNLRAYEYWLHGMEQIKKGTSESDLEARKFFQLAIDTEPSYSLAYSGMSLSYFNEWSCQLWERWDVAKNGAHDWAIKAIELDEQNHHAAMVLGRTYLYNGDYDTAEHYLRRTLRLNPNDIECLVQVATCFTYLGYHKEAQKLFQRIISLQPPNEINLYYIGAFIYFEGGEFEQALVYRAKVQNAPWVDFKAFMAATFFHTGDFKKMNEEWAAFLSDFSQKIDCHETNVQVQAIKWLKDVNPYRGSSKLDPFLAHVSGSPVQNATIGETEKNEPAQPAIFSRDGAGWHFSYNGIAANLPDVKGFYDLAQLLGKPGEAIHCSTLMGSALSESGEALFDEKAKKNYQQKILELQQEIQQAELHNDPARAERLQQEYDSLLDHLSASLGLKGKVRKASNNIEKARTAVTWRVRKAIQKIEAVHPSLGKHLELSVKTGVFCSYSPEITVKWTF